MEEAKEGKNDFAFFNIVHPSINLDLVQTGTKTVKKNGLHMVQQRLFYGNF